MREKSTYHPLIPVSILVGLSMFFLFIFWGKVVIAPNDYLFNDKGDGLKNYFTLVHYVKYDTGHHFSGMLYPYGEHIIYTDNQPAIAWILKGIHQFLYDIENEIPGIIHILLFLGLVLCALYTYLLLIRFKVSYAFAVFGALLITFLSPQIARFSGHYSLGYACFFPMLWYYLIQYMRSTWRWSRMIGIIFLLTFFGFIHLYYLLIGISFLLSFAFVHFLANREKLRSNLLAYTQLFAMAILPFLIIRLFLFYTDPILDRPTAPYGFLSYHAFLGSIFIPGHGPLRSFWEMIFYKLTYQFEAQVYLGLIPSLTLVFLFVRQIKKSFTQRLSFFDIPSSDSLLTYSFWAGILVLLFSMALPFRWGLAFLLDWIPLLKQFRSVGRFAWVFYYILSVYSVCFLYLQFQKMKLKSYKKTALGIATVALFVWFAEVWVYHKMNPNKYLVNNTIFNEDSSFDFPDYFKLDARKFQAILPLSMPLIGSEKNFLEGGREAFPDAIKLISKTGLPMIGANLSRTSISQTLNTLQILSSPYLSKRILEDFGEDKRPILILWSGEDLGREERLLLKKASFLVEGNGVKLYELSLDAFSTQLGWLKKYFDKDIGKFVNREGYYTKDSTTFFVHKNYPETSVSKPIPGWHDEAGLYTQDSIVLYDGLWGGTIEKSDIEASVWVRANPDHFNYPTLYFYHYNPEGKLVKKKVSAAGQMVETDGEWMRVNATNIVRFGDRVSLVLMGDQIEFDHFLIRPKNRDIFYGLKKDGSFIFNNYFVPSKINPL